MSFREQLNQIDRDAEAELAFDESSRVHPIHYTITNNYYTTNISQPIPQTTAKNSLLFDMVLWATIAGVTVISIFVVSVVR